MYWSVSSEARKALSSSDEFWWDLMATGTRLLATARRSSVQLSILLRWLHGCFKTSKWIRPRKDWIIYCHAILPSGCVLECQHAQTRCLRVSLSSGWHCWLRSNHGEENVQVYSGSSSELVNTSRLIRPSNQSATILQTPHDPSYPCRNFCPNST